MPYGIDHQILKIDFNLFSSSEQHFGISYQVTLIQNQGLFPTEECANQTSTTFGVLHRFILTKEIWITSSPSSAIFLTSKHLCCHL